MNAKSNYFLREFLKPKRNTDDNISIRLSILFILKHIAPKKFKELKLDEYLESVISEIKGTAEKPTSLLKSVISKIKGMVAKPTSLYDLQAKLDYWYYTKLLGYGDKYKVNGEMIKKFMTDDKIKNVTNPRDAVLLYIYVRTLSCCDSKKYGQFNKYLPLLKKVAKKDYNFYAYLLTHVILYDTHFGQKKAPKSSFEALGELHSFCKNKLKFERANVDLMSEIIICCKLCKAYDFPFYSKLLKNVIPTRTFQSYHENAVLTAATFEQKLS
jgi:hypothetical protein